MALVELLLSGVVDARLQQSLSAAGRRLLRSMQQTAATTTVSAAPSRSVPPPPLSVVGNSGAAAAASASRRQRIVGSLPVIDLTGARPHSTVSSRPLAQSTRRSISFDADPPSASDSSSPEPLSPSADGLPPSIVAALVRMGVPESLAVDDLLQQTAETVSPSSYQLYWSSRESAIGDKKLYYEGLVLSMVLDAAGDTRLLLEVAARRWLTLSAVALGNRDWASAQAFLPLNRSNGLTARQIQLMEKYGRSSGHPVRSSSSSSSSSNSKWPSSRRPSSRQSGASTSHRERSTSRTRRGDNSGNSGSSNNTSNSNTTRSNRGAGARGSRPSEAPSTGAQ
jgi:hypothetical protein